MLSTLKPSRTKTLPVTDSGRHRGLYLPCQVEIDCAHVPFGFFTHQDVIAGSAATQAEAKVACPKGPCTVCIIMNLKSVLFSAGRHIL